MMAQYKMASRKGILNIKDAQVYEKWMYLFWFTGNEPIRQ